MNNSKNKNNKVIYWIQYFLLLIAAAACYPLVVNLLKAIFGGLLGL